MSDKYDSVNERTKEIAKSMKLPVHISRGVAKCSRNLLGKWLMSRVVSSEISGNFPRKISGNLFQSFRKFPEIC